MEQETTSTAAANGGRGGDGGRGKGSAHGTFKCQSARPKERGGKGRKSGAAQVEAAQERTGGTGRAEWRNSPANSSLIQAAVFGNLNRVKALLSASADKKVDLFAVDGDGENALHS
jgi:hypothetical protein